MGLKEEVNKRIQQYVMQKELRKENENKGKDRFAKKGNRQSKVA